MSAASVPSYDRCEVGSVPLVAASFPDSTLSDDVDARKILAEWLTAFETALASKNYSELKDLFLAESYYRDQLCLSWNIHTFKGPDAIITFLQGHSKGSRLQKLSIDETTNLMPPSVQPIDFLGEVKAIVSFINVETDVGRGRGLVRLSRDANDGKYKAFSLFTAMLELNGFEESVSSRRPHGVRHGYNPGKRNWLELRTEEQSFTNTEPTVLIIGAGQSGLTLAARLRHLNVSTLIVDRNERIGDNWRKRYHHLVLHDPVFYDHLPYINFPPGYPKFIPKDKLADWFESYAKMLELNTWTSTELKSLKYSDTEKRWTVNLVRSVNGDIESRTLRPRFVVQATGLSGEKNFPLNINGINDFQGDLLCHSSEFPGATPNSTGKKAIVVGCCNSALDIAQDFCENGYDTTVIQRSSTYVMSSEDGLAVALGALYCEGAPPVEEADLIFVSIPNQMLKRLHLDSFKEIARRDATLRDGLTKAGFKLDEGPDNSGLYMKYFQRGGGYYIDVGAAQLIIDGKIKVKQGQEISSVNAHSLTFSDGTELPADEVVFATGFLNMRTTSRKIFGDEIADQLQDAWGFDEEGELRTVWRRTGHEGVWFMGGNLALCRYYSRILALQLKALDEGIMKYDDL